jgi:adenylyltransferase/sulfurtransferase
VLTRKTLVYGSIFRFDGQASVFVPGEGPCYRCLFPEPTPVEMAPSCDEAGVLGVLPGIVGLIQATETLKVLLGRGRTLKGRLLTFDALAMTFKEYRIRRDPACTVCGDAPTIRELSDLQWSCHFTPRDPVTA